MESCLKLFDLVNDEDYMYDGKQHRERKLGKWRRRKEKLGGQLSQKDVKTAQAAE